MIGVAVGPANGETDLNSRYVYDDYDKIPEGRPRERGMLLDLRIGYTMTPRLRVCIESCGWSRHLDDAPGIARVDYLLTGGGVEWMTGPFTMRMILGLGTSRVDYIERGDHKHQRDMGSGYLFALGWEKQFGKRFTAGPQFVYFGHLGKDTDVWIDTYGIMFNLSFFSGD